MDLKKDFLIIAFTLYIVYPAFIKFKNGLICKKKNNYIQTTNN